MYHRSLDRTLHHAQRRSCMQVWSRLWCNTNTVTRMHPQYHDDCWKHFATIVHNFAGHNYWRLRMMLGRRMILGWGSGWRLFGFGQGSGKRCWVWVRKWVEGAWSWKRMGVAWVWMRKAVPWILMRQVVCKKARQEGLLHNNKLQERGGCIRWQLLPWLNQPMISTAWRYSTSCGVKQWSVDDVPTIWLFSSKKAREKPTKRISSNSSNCKSGKQRKSLIIIYLTFILVSAMHRICHKIVPPGSKHMEPPVQTIIGPFGKKRITEG